MLISGGAQFRVLTRGSSLVVSLNLRPLKKQRRKHKLLRAYEQN